MKEKAAKDTGNDFLTILIVDDEANIRKTLSYCLAAEGHTVISVGASADAEDEAKRRSFDLAFVDLRLGNEDGMELIPVLLSESPWIQIVVMTAYASIETAVSAMRQGAADYIAKPFTPDQVRFLTQRATRLRRLEMENASLKEHLGRMECEPGFHTLNPVMRRAVETARKAAASEAVILLRGESGTGKSVLARAIHHWSRRSGKPMAVVSCPTMPADLLESELFGHVRGAFTGAVQDHSGRVAMCEGGTLFLDEIADLAPPVQAKLLRFAQDREYERIGDPVSRKADVRIIAATNADLENRVAEGRFREDLFYRLNVISITIPPLRDRTEDITPMALEFLGFFARINHKMRHGFTEDAMGALKSHSWPGNVRELRNTVERAVILGSSDRVHGGDLPDTLRRGKQSPAIGDRVPLSTIEELHIRRVIASSASLQEAAAILGIDQATLWRRRKTYGI